MKAVSVLIEAGLFDWTRGTFAQIPCWNAISRRQEAEFLVTYRGYEVASSTSEDVERGTVTSRSANGGGESDWQGQRFVEWLHRQAPVYGHTVPTQEGLWFDIGSHEQYAEANRMLERFRQR